MKKIGARASFGLVALGALIVLLIAGWFCIPVLSHLLHGPTALLASVFGLATSIDVAPTGEWTIWSARRIDSGPLLGRNAGIQLSLETFRSIMRGAPLYFALMLAPPRAPRLFTKLIVGALILFIVFVLAALAEINLSNAVLVNGQAAPLGTRALPPNFTVTGERYSETAFNAAIYLRYVALFVAPLIAPVALWALQNPAAIAMLRRPREA